MKLLPVAFAIAFAVITIAAPVTHDSELSNGLTLDEVTEVVEMIDQMETSASESETYILKKIKRGIKRGVKVDIRVRPASAAHDGDDESNDLTLEELTDIVDSIDSLEASASADQAYILKKIKRGIKRGIKIEARIRPAASVHDAGVVSNDLSQEELTELLGSIAHFETSASERQLYFLKKIKRGIKRGIKIEARIRPAVAALGAEETDGHFSQEEMKNLLECIDRLESSASENQKYFLKKIKRGIKKGIKIEARIRPAHALQDAQKTSDELSQVELSVMNDALDRLEASASEDQLYILKKIKRGIKRGIKIEARIRPAIAVNNAGELSEALSEEELSEMLESIDQLQASASESQMFILKKIKRGIKRGIKIEARIRPAVAAFLAGGESDDLSLDELTEIVEDIDLLASFASESQLYFLKKIKRGIKKGVKVDIRVRPASAAADTDAGMTLEDVQGFLDAVANLEEVAPSDATYIGSKFRKGLRKISRAIEKSAKKIGKALERAAKKVTEERKRLTVPF